MRGAEHELCHAHTIQPFLQRYHVVLPADGYDLWRADWQRRHLYVTASIRKYRRGIHITLRVARYSSNARDFKKVTGFRESAARGRARAPSYRAAIYYSSSRALARSREHAHRAPRRRGGGVAGRYVRPWSRQVAACHAPEGHRPGLLRIPPSLCFGGAGGGFHSLGAGATRSYE